MPQKKLPKLDIYGLQGYTCTMLRNKFPFLRPRVKLAWSPEHASLAVARKKDKQIILDALAAASINNDNQASTQAGLIVLQNLSLISNPETATLSPSREPFCIKRNDTDFVVAAIVRNQDPDLAGTSSQQRAESLVGALLVSAQVLSDNHAVKS